MIEVLIALAIGFGAGWFTAALRAFRIAQAVRNDFAHNDSREAKTKMIACSRIVNRLRLLLW